MKSEEWFVFFVEGECLSCLFPIMLPLNPMCLQNKEQSRACWRARRWENIVSYLPKLAPLCVTP